MQLLLFLYATFSLYFLFIIFKRNFSKPKWKSQQCEIFLAFFFLFDELFFGTVLFYERSDITEDGQV